ncbi:MAG: pyruvate dehydrogenase complex transcriptional repressor PdhR [Bacillales bacterium]|jgi:ArsR family transcriptional regulator|nr:pyruvate dehydrogenase complex transcriptional repressor PdhR [Bacillales bacterium]
MQKKVTRGIGMEKTFDEIAASLKLLSDPTRLKILSCIQNEERCVCEITPLFELSQPAISQQLKKLKDGGILLERKEGTWVYYRLAPDLDKYIVDILSLLPKNKQSNCC